jgi:Tfp pilus assembly protein PilO
MDTNIKDETKKRLRTINLIGAAGVLALLAGAAAFGVAPMWSKGVKAIANSSQLKTQLAELESVKLQSARVEEELKSREARLKTAEALLPSAGSVNLFVPELAKVAEKAGLQVDRVTPAKDFKDAGDYKLLSVQVGGRGDWDTCYKFLTGLRGKERKLTRLDSLTLEVDREKTTDRPVCKLSVEISTFLAR